MWKQILRGAVLGLLVAAVAIGALVVSVDGAGERVRSLLANHGLVADQWGQSRLI